MILLLVMLVKIINDMRSLPEVCFLEVEMTEFQAEKGSLSRRKELECSKLSDALMSCNLTGPDELSTIQ